MDYSSQERLQLQASAKPLSVELLGHYVRKKESVFAVQIFFRRAKRGNKKILETTGSFSAAQSILACCP